MKIEPVLHTKTILIWLFHVIIDLQCDKWKNVICSLLILRSFHVREFFVATAAHRYDAGLKSYWISVILRKINSA